ncbi:MAG: GTP-binding protein, partial [Acidimicrobiales bacterium]
DAIAALLDLASRQPGSAVALAPPQLFDPHVVTTIPLPHGATDADIVEELEKLGPDVVRAKGVFEAADGRRRLIQVVGGRRSITELPTAEDEPPTDLVVISLQR